MVKRRKCCMLILLVISILTGCGTATKTQVEDGNSNGERDLYLDNSLKVDEEKRLGGYNFILENVLYDEKTHSGYIHMSVTSDDKDVSKLKMYTDLGSKISDGEKIFEFIPTYNKEITDYEYKDGKFSIYCLFVDQQEMLNGQLLIRDYESKEAIEYALPDNKCSECYIYEGKEIWISPISIFVDNIDYESIKAFTIVLKNHEEIEVKKEYNLCDKVYSGRVGLGEDAKGYLWLNEYLDYTNIDYLEIDNVKVERK